MTNTIISALQYKVIRAICLDLVVQNTLGTFFIFYLHYRIDGSVQSRVKSLGTFKTPSCQSVLL